MYGKTYTMMLTTATRANEAMAMVDICWILSQAPAERAELGQAPEHQRQDRDRDDGTDDRLCACPAFAEAAAGIASGAVESSFPS